MNCNRITQKTSLNVNIFFLIAIITDEMTKSPVMKTDRQSIKKRPIVNGIVKIVTRNRHPKTNMQRYAGACINFTIIANFAN
jgi:hypothetical protein